MSKANSYLLFTPTVAQSLFSMLNWIYRNGVSAAYLSDDEGLCREFLEETAEPGKYGIIRESEAVYFDIIEWQVKMSTWAMRTSLHGAMSTFIRYAGAFGSNYLSAMFPLLFQLYRRGIKDYWDAPYAADIEQFYSRSRCWWTDKGLRTVRNDDFKAYAQNECFELMRRDAAERERLEAARALCANLSEKMKVNISRVVLKDEHYRRFATALGLAWRGRG